jgi:serine/threonine protein kinase
VDDALIDDGLLIVRRLWDAGLAHRDIKPANLMVHEGKVKLIDVAFAQIRPSPWRQAVDLANMMLVLAVRTDPARVYQRALQFFTPEEIAEAFAATRGIASPTQLRAAMKQDGRDLVAEFRALAPERRPIPLQRWGVRRVLMALGMLLLALIAVNVIGTMFVPVHDVEVEAQPHCDTSSVMILMAQPSPCCHRPVARWKERPRYPATSRASSVSSGRSACPRTCSPPATTCSRVAASPTVSPSTPTPRRP